MDYSNFIVLLARQRSGTNVLRSVLRTHPEIFCIPEVFDNRMDTDYLVDGGSDYFNPGEVSYFDFLDKYSRGNIKKILLPDDHENIFLDFLEYLRCFTTKRFLVLDVKYMSAHQITKNWHFITEEPFFFSLIKKHNLRVLNLTRKNFLRYFLSELKAQQSQTWDEFDESVVGDQSWYIRPKYSVMDRQEPRITVITDQLLETLRLCHSEDKVVEDSFSEYEHYLTFDYDDMFAYSGAPVSPSVLERFAQWVGIDSSFAETRPEYKKLSQLMLKEAIENYEEVVQALRGTKFEYCLQDEGIYLNVPATSAIKHDQRRGGMSERTSHISNQTQSTMKDLEAVIGSRPETFCDALFGNRPEWITGSLSHSDTRFLFKTALKIGASLAVEIGTASGFSTSVLCHALNFACQAGLIDSDFHVVSYDVSPYFYADKSKRVGNATREQLSPKLLKHITFRHPTLASSLKQYHGNDDIRFMFIDANHQHPWPTLDLLATLDLLKPGAVVLLHDINLPVRDPRFQEWGVKYLFDGLDLEKDVPDDAEIPNIGRLKIPYDKEQLRGQLLKILFAHEWQWDVNDDYVASLGITREREHNQL